MLPDIAAVDGTYGGPYVNHAPVEDPTSDMDASYGNELLADVAGATHTVDRAWARIAGQTATGSTAVVDHDAVWGSTAAVAPTCNHSSTPTYVFTWATTYADELGDTKTINVRKPRSWVAGSTTGRAVVSSWTPNTVTINCLDALGNPNALDGKIIFVAWS